MIKENQKYVKILIQSKLNLVLFSYYLIIQIYHSPKMIQSQIKKYQKYQNQSLMALNSNNQSQTTKKTIETQQFYNFHPTIISNNRKYAFSLPFSTEISTLVNTLTVKFSEQIIHVQSDIKSAQIILEGLKMKGIKRFLGKILDYCVFCCSRGIKYGILQETYNVIVITIKREVIQNRCIITVSNPYRQADLQSIFVSKILDPISQQLKALGKQMELNLDQEIGVKNQYLNDNSPCQLQIHIHKKIYDLFVLQEIKDLGRYKNLFLHSLEKVKEQLEKHLQKLNLSINKKNLPNPGTIVEVFIQQTQNLMVCLQNSYKQQQNQQLSFLHSLLTSESAQQITLYKIQEALCLYQMPYLKEIYSRHISEQCQAFNQNINYVNLNFSDEDCFNHLELRDKFRLPKENKPYQSAIERLKKIQYCISFREMLLVIQQCFSEVKSDCLISHEGKVELSSMDDLLPVMIFVTVRAGIINFPVIVKIIDDYVRSKSVFELEERVMTTLYVAIEDISRKWQKKQKI